ncbi:MAG: organic solvent tolerance protein OstA [Phenylobacterium sp.]|uniref:LptA/OstA family protein n=1 Tax=Phenylobacterium sp. TaxID=1871053 RepID=UPI001A46E4F1|nr:LptA/OstA family protein [Phenylobacterium sp.]MBL8771923.1 organic solvent tolerance protein OstA [Phenylobacterium sp.]
MNVVLTPVLLGLALAAAPLAAASAQGLGPDSDGKPMDITADELEVQNKACVSTWRGKAEALQGSARLRANVIRAVFATKPGASGGTGTGACGDLIRIEAEGDVYYVTSKDQRVRGDNGVYDASSETVTLTGDVVAVQGQNVLRGSRMVFNSTTGEGRMVGTATGRNAQGRPRGVFYPSKKNQTASK